MTDKSTKKHLFEILYEIERNILTQPIARPLGVTIIAILAIIAGILLVFGGLSLLALGSLFAAFPAGNMISEQQQQISAGYSESSGIRKSITVSW